MAQLNRTSWKNLYGLLGTIFPDNTTSEISESDMRTFGENLADSFLNKSNDLIDDDTFATASSTTVPSSESVKAYNDTFVVPVASSGTAIAFDKLRTYGYATAETGNITLNATGLKEGITQLIIHNHSSEPTFGSEFKVIQGEYTISVDNYIMMHSVKSNVILVTISQEI